MFCKYFFVHNLNIFEVVKIWEKAKNFPVFLVVTSEKTLRKQKEESIWAIFVIVSFQLEAEWKKNVEGSYLLPKTQSIVLNPKHKQEEQ